MQWYVVETATCFSLMPPASFVPNETKRDDDLASHAIYPCKHGQRTRWKVLPVLCKAAVSKIVCFPETA